MAKESDITLVENHPKLWLDFLPELQDNDNKYTRGNTLIIGGYPLTGASRLAAYAASRVGSGLTTLLVPELAFPVYASALTSIMVRPFGDVSAFNHVIRDERINCFLIGPGAGVSEGTRNQVFTLLNTSKPVVLDADAISIFKNNLSTLTQHLNPNCVLTPHDGEFKRLFTLTNDRALSALQAAKAADAVIILKGHQTIIASPDGQVITNNNAPPTLATGGAGDVLAGIVAGLIAQGMPAFQAAAAATWIHGEAANLFGIGLIAEDLPHLLPQVFKKFIE